MKIDLYTKVVLTACVLFLAIISLQLWHPTGYDCDACGWDVSRSTVVCPRCGNPDPAYSDRQEEEEREKQRQAEMDNRYETMDDSTDSHDIEENPAKAGLVAGDAQWEDFLSNGNPQQKTFRAFVAKVRAAVDAGDVKEEDADLICRNVADRYDAYPISLYSTLLDDYLSTGNPFYLYQLKGE